MGIQATTTNLSYARNEYIGVGHSFVFDKVADMIYYIMTNDDISTTSTTTLTVGSDGTGYDVTFYSDTSGCYFLWDQSADEVVLAGRIRFLADASRTGEGSCLFANGVSIGMATPGACEGIKMEFDYGVTPSALTGQGKSVHGLDIKMTMDQDWDFSQNLYNGTVRGARIQAISEDDMSGRLTGAYINARAEGEGKTIRGYISGAVPTGPGIIGLQARTELGIAGSTTTPAMAGIVIMSRIRQDATLTGAYRGLEIEVPMLGTGASISSTTDAIHIGNDWGGTDTFDRGIYIDTSVCGIGVYIGTCTTGIQLAGTQTTGITIGANVTTAINVDSTTASTTTSTGAVVIDGGLAVKLGLFVGEVVSVGSVCQPDTNSGAALGSTSLQWSDLFLATTAVINWDNGEITLTHSEVGKLAIDATWTTVGATGRPFVSNLTTDVQLGSYANALKGYVNCSTDGGASGLMSAVCCEILMATSCDSGNYAAVELEMVYGATSGSLPHPCFIYANTAGTARGDFDTYGDLIKLGPQLSAGSGKMIGTGTSTLRIGTGALCAVKRYIPLSTVAETYTTAYPIVSTYAGGTALSFTATTASTSLKAITVETDTTATSGTHDCIYVDSTSSGVGSCSARGIYSRVEITGNLQTASSWPSAIYARLELENMTVNHAGACVQAMDVRIEDTANNATMTAFDEFSVASFQSMQLGGDVSGKNSQIIRLANNGTVTWNAFMGIHGNEKVKYMFRFSGCGGSTPMLSQAPLAASHGGETWKIKIRHEDISTDLYLLASTTPA